MKKREIIYFSIIGILLINIILVLAVNYDLNGDGNVTFSDLQEMASHYHTKAAYNSTYDLNNDAKVDLFDIVGLAKKVNLSAGSSGGNANGNFYGGANEPVGFKPIFLLDGTSVNPEDNNPGITPYIGSIGDQWDINGSPVDTSDTNSNHVEVVSEPGMPSGYAIRKWWFDVDPSSGFNGIITVPDISGYTPENWSAPVGTKRTWYMRYVISASPNWNLYGKLPFFGAYYANEFAPVFQGGGGAQIKINKGGPDVGTWASSNLNWFSPKGEIHDVEIIFTTESTSGAADGEWHVWVDDVPSGSWEWLGKGIYRNETGWEWTDTDDVGLKAFQLLGMAGNGGDLITEDIYIDWGLFYVSASPD